MRISPTIPAILAFVFGWLGQSAEKADLSDATLALPLAFEANHGQAGPSVRFLVRGANATLLLSSGKADFVQSSGGSLRMRFLHADSHAKIEGLDPIPLRSNYLLGRDERQWHTGIPNYQRVRYRRIYPSIDLIFHTNDRRLEYDFQLAPGADVNRIALSFEGGGKAEIAENGELVVKTVSGPVRYGKPVAWQERNGVRTEISSRYIVKGAALGFHLGPHDPALPVVIDPIVYSTIAALGIPQPSQ